MMLDKTQSNLLMLLRSSLWATECSPLTVIEVKDAMRLANAHTVSGLVAGLFMDNKVAVAKGPGKEDAMMDMAEAVANHRWAYANHCRAVSELDDLLSAGGIEYVVFKGTSSASHYPVPSLRTMGDVDFYVPKQYYDKAVSMIEGQWHEDVTHEASEKHLSFDHREIRFEIHHRVETFGTRRHQRIFDDAVDNGMRHAVRYSLEAGQYANALPAELDITVVFKHIYTHLLLEGVGLRQLVDLAMLLDDYQDRVDVKSLRGLLTRLGYIHVFDATVSMLADYIGLPCAEIYSPLTSYNRWWGDRIMKIVMESGNFGRLSYKELGSGLGRSAETAAHAFRHCLVLSPLMPAEMPAFTLRRLGITLNKHIHGVEK